jgi:hypothetical protein
MAETEFAESAYIPYWTAIENATTELGAFIERVDRITEYANEYSSVAATYQGAVDPFAVSLNAAARLRASEDVTRRIETVTRPAHRDPHFAQIFLQMRGNEILASGFANLGDALGRMTIVLTNAIAQVNSSIEAVGSQMARVEGGITSLNAVTRLHHNDVIVSSHQASSRFRELERQQARSVQMLDNIQNHRRPLLG